MRHVSQGSWRHDQGSKWDGMDQYGIPALPSPPGKHTGTTFLKKVIPVCLAGHFVRFRQLVAEVCINQWPKNRQLEGRKDKKAKHLFFPTSSPGHDQQQTVSKQARRWRLQLVYAITTCDPSSASQGMCNSVLQTLYWAVIISKLTYVSSAWWGFSTAVDRQRLNAFIRRTVCVELYQTDDLTIQQLVEDADDKLFSNILNNLDHTLHYLLPKETTHDYDLTLPLGPRLTCRLLNVSICG